MFDRTDAFAVTEMDLHLDVVDRGRLAVLAGDWPHQSCWSGHDCRYQHERCAGEGHQRADEGVQAVGNRPAIGASAPVWTPFKKKNTSYSEPCELSEVAEVEEDVPTWHVGRSTRHRRHLAVGGRAGKVLARPVLTAFASSDGYRPSRRLVNTSGVAERVV